MKTYQVWYRKPLNHTEVKSGLDLPLSHILVEVVNANHPDEVFGKMQGEVWSPNGEKRDFILACGLSHTSMSVGDVLWDIKSNMLYHCERIGWTVIPVTGEYDGNIRSG